MPQPTNPFLISASTASLTVGKGELLGSCRTALGGTPPAFVFRVPGRVEVLGKHTDYAGGRSITCAIDRGFIVAVRPRSDSHVLAYACDLQQSVGFDLIGDMPVRSSGWQNYVQSVARRLAGNFGQPLHGVDMAFASDLPQASGMSSSSALVVATYLALNAANDFNQREAFRQNISCEEDLAGYLGACENGMRFGTLAGDTGVGTFGGSEDHTAILLSQPGHLGLYTYAPVRCERMIAWPADMALLIATSGVRAEKTAAAREKYNRIALLMRAIMEVLRANGWDKSTLASAIGDDPHAATCVAEILGKTHHRTYSPGELQERFWQFAQEHQVIIPQAANAIAAENWAALGTLVDQSQMLAETALHNQIPQTTYLAHAARKIGAVAASAFGAGFGGSVWAMAPRHAAADFLQQWRQDYAAHFPTEARRAQFFATSPSR